MNGDTTAGPRPAAPLIAPENRPFWDAANEQRLLIKACTSCERLHWYPRAHCPWCLSAKTEWRQVSGKGRVYSYSISGGRVIAYVELDEGITLLSNLVNADPAQLCVGAAVRVCFVAAENGQQVPMFEPRRV